MKHSEVRDHTHTTTTEEIQIGFFKASKSSYEQKSSKAEEEAEEGKGTLVNSLHKINKLWF